MSWERKKSEVDQSSLFCLKSLLRLCNPQVPQFWDTSNARDSPAGPAGLLAFLQSPRSRPFSCYGKVSGEHSETTTSSPLPLLCHTAVHMANPVQRTSQQSPTPANKNPLPVKNPRKFRDKGMYLRTMRHTQGRKGVEVLHDFPRNCFNESIVKTKKRRGKGFARPT